MKRGTATKWSLEMINAAVDDFVRKNNRLPVAVEFKLKHGLPSRRTIAERTGQGALVYCKSRHPGHAQDKPTLPKRRWTETSFAEAVEQFVERTGRLPEYDDFSSRNGLPNPTLFIRLGISYTAFCQERHPDLLQKAVEEPEEIMMKM